MSTKSLEPTILNNKRRKLNYVIEAQYNPFSIATTLHIDLVKIVMEYSDYDFCLKCKEL